jgi:signal transduction histidine kinase
MRTSEKGKKLSSGLLMFAKGGVLDMKTIALPDLVREACAFALQGSNVTCEISTGEGLWPVEAEKDQISHVITNLVINALQSMPGGIIKVSARNIIRESKNDKPGGKFVVIQIEDSGPGITAEDLERIFDPLFVTKKNSSGLGLPVAQSIVKRHGGFIEAQSIMGAGTLFYVYLPASEKTPATDKL